MTDIGAVSEAISGTLLLWSAITVILLGYAAIKCFQLAASKYFTVVSCAAGTASLVMNQVMLEHNTADLVLMDVLIPGSINGISAAKIIKERSPATKIIIVTSMPETVSFLSEYRLLGVVKRKVLCYNEKCKIVLWRKLL